MPPALIRCEQYRSIRVLLHITHLPIGGHKSAESNPVRDFPNVPGMCRSNDKTPSSIETEKYVNENSLAPTITQAAVRFGVEISIVCGNIEVLQNCPVGSLFVAIRGDEDSILRTTDFFAEQGVKVRKFEEGGVIHV